MDEPTEGTCTGRGDELQLTLRTSPAQPLMCAGHITEVAGSDQMKKLNLCEACWNDSEISKKLRGKSPGSTGDGLTRTFLPDDERGH
jgi:hypothetical protein